MIDHLSPSSLNTFMKCPRQWYFRYIEGIKTPPAGAAFTGSTAHKTCQFALQPVIVGKEMPAPKTLVEHFNDTFVASEKAEEIIWGKQEPHIWRADGISAIRSHGDRLLPHIAPHALEAKYRKPIPDTPFDMLGYVDVVEEKALRDHKFTGRMKPQSDADQSLQLSAYSWMSGKQELSLEVSTWGGKSARLTTHRTPKQTQFYLERVLIPTALQINHCIETGNFPCHLEGWHCSASWCGYWGKCVGK
jgi:hypothetical protein